MMGKNPEITIISEYVRKSNMICEFCKNNKICKWKHRAINNRWIDCAHYKFSLLIYLKKNMRFKYSVVRGIWITAGRFIYKSRPK